MRVLILALYAAAVHNAGAFSPSMTFGPSRVGFPSISRASPLLGAPSVTHKQPLLLPARAESLLSQSAAATDLSQVHRPAI